MENRLMVKSIQSQLQEHNNIISSIIQDPVLLDCLSEVVCNCCRALANGKKILLAGNGGSAADAQHMAAEYVSKLSFDRPALPAIALTVDTSILTAISNDYGFENIFSRQIEALGQSGDIFFAYSTSGKSKNIIKAIKTANMMNLQTVGLFGNPGNSAESMCNHSITVPSTNTARIQECHAIIGHVICAAIEEETFR